VLVVTSFFLAQPVFSDSFLITQRRTVELTYS